MKLANLLVGLIRSNSSVTFVASSKTRHVKIAIRAIKRRLAHVSLPTKIARYQTRSRGCCDGCWTL